MKHLSAIVKVHIPEAPTEAGCTLLKVTHPAEEDVEEMRSDAEELLNVAGVECKITIAWTSNR